jgi:hypothetical protein
LVVAHRLSTIRNADMILVFENVIPLFYLFDDIFIFYDFFFFCVCVCVFFSHHFLCFDFVSIPARV